MRKILLFIISFFVSVSLFAQTDVTKFLGIPVDGFKPEMIQKLKAKGFVSSEFDNDILQGEFNGAQVYLHVVTNNNKVYRIMLTDAIRVDEIAIKNRFNTLCKQFKNNSRYFSFGDYTIPSEEDISYEMSVNNKRYEAAFYQTMKVDSAAIQNEVADKILKKYSEEEIVEKKDEIYNEIFEYTIESMTKKSVWFMISESYGKYYIAMYYDNEYNKANGEDL